MRCSPTRSGSAPRSPKSPSTTVRSRSPGSWKAAQRRRRGGSDAPAGRCRRRRGQPHLPLRRQAHTGHRTDRARNGRRLAARVMSPRTPPTVGRPCGHGGAKALGHGRDGPPIGSVARPAAGPTQRGPHPGPLGAAARRNVSDTDQRGPAADHRRAHRRNHRPRTAAAGTLPIGHTLLDHCRHPAAGLAALHHERWEIESAFHSLRHTLQTGLLLRSQDPAGVQQEL